MKGLLLKDLAYIRRSRLLGIVVFMAAVFSFTGSNFAVTYMGIMASTMVQTTFSYDDFRGGMKYILTLPITRKQYVQSKYLLSVLLGSCGIVVGSLVQLVLQPGNGYTVGETVALLLTSGGVVLLLNAINIPMLLKYGAERGRLMAVCVLVGVAAIIGVGAFVLMDLINISPAECNIWMATAGLLAVVVVSLWISYRISLKIMEKKEY